MSARRPLIAGNWKLNHGPAAARALATALRDALGAEDDLDLVVFPSALSVPATVEVLRDTAVGVGVQWAHAEPTGAYTGANSAVFARELGCGWLLAGHSEARRDLAETDARVHASARAGLRHGLLPIVCVGETLEQRCADRVEAVLGAQLDAALGALHPDEVVTLTLAYEPIWAIGTGETASPEQAQQVHAFLRARLAARFPPFVAAQLRVLYGGSVKPGNAASLLAQPDIDGVLVGGASLEAASFIGIVDAARP